MDRLPRLGKRELICLLLFTCNYVVSVWRGFLFLWVLAMGYVIFNVALPEPSITLFCLKFPLTFVGCFVGYWPMSLLCSLIQSLDPLMTFQVRTQD